MKAIWPINIQIDMKLRTKTELSRSIGMDLFPILKQVKQDPSLKQSAQSSMRLTGLSSTAQQKRKNFSCSVSRYLTVKVTVSVITKTTDTV